MDPTTYHSSQYTEPIKQSKVHNQSVTWRHVTYAEETKNICTTSDQASQAAGLLNKEDVHNMSTLQTTT